MATIPQPEDQKPVPQSTQPQPAPPQAQATQKPIQEQVIVINNRERGLIMLLIELFFVIFFPPVTALFERGCGIDLLLNVLLTLLGWIPGMIHALYLIYVGNGNVDVEQGVVVKNTTTTQTVYVEGKPVANLPNK